MILIDKNDIYELPHELWNNLRLRLRKLGNITKVSKPHRMASSGKNEDFDNTRKKNGKTRINLFL